MNAESTSFDRSEFEHYSHGTLLAMAQEAYDANRRDAAIFLADLGHEKFVSLTGESNYNPRGLDLTPHDEG